MWNRLECCACTFLWQHLAFRLGAGNGTLLSDLGLNNITLNVSALVPSTSCPNGGLLNTALGLGNNCLGITAISPEGVLQVCTAQNDACCCSSGESSPNSLLWKLHEEHRSTFDGAVMDAPTLHCSSKDCKLGVTKASLNDCWYGGRAVLADEAGSPWDADPENQLTKPETWHLTIRQCASTETSRQPF